MGCYFSFPPFSRIVLSSYVDNHLFHSWQKFNILFFWVQTRKPELLVVSPSGRFVGMPDNHTLRIWKSPVENIESVKEIKMMLLHHTKGLSTLAFHSNDTIVAGGDVTGRILI